MFGYRVCTHFILQLQLICCTHHSHISQPDLFVIQQKSYLICFYIQVQQLMQMETTDKNNLPIDPLETSLLTTHETSQNKISRTEDNLDNAQQNVVKKTSLNAAMFAMMASALGTGIFNLPMRIAQIGVAMFIIYVFICGIFSYLGCSLLHKLIVVKKFDNYGDICQSAYGIALKRILQICIILFPWGIAVCFQVIMPKFILQLLSDVFHVQVYKDRQKQYIYIILHIGFWLRILINILLIATNFFLIKLKSIRTIQKLAIIGVCSVIFNAICIFVIMILGFVHHVDKDNIDIVYHGIFKLDWKLVQWFSFGDNALSVHPQALASVLFCYINHQLVFPTCKNMDNPTDQRLKMCFFRSNLYELILYISIGVSGYLLLVQHEDILPIGPIVLASIDYWPITIGKFLMIVTLYLAVPLNLFPARTVLQETLQLQRTDKNHYLLSAVLAISSCALAISFVGINSYFGLLGGTAGVLIGGGIPAICFWRLFMKDDPKQRTCKNYLSLLLIFIITIITFIGAILSITNPA